jgi:hypothetical protein
VQALHGVAPTEVAPKSDVAVQTDVVKQKRVFQVHCFIKIDRIVQTPISGVTATIYRSETMNFYA